MDNKHFLCWVPDVSEEVKIVAINHNKAAWKFFWIEIADIGEQYEYDFDICVKLDKKYARTKTFTAHAEAELTVDIGLKEKEND